MGISKEFGISVGLEKLRFGLKTWIWALMGNAPQLEDLNQTTTKTAIEKAQKTQQSTKVWLK